MFVAVLAIVVLGVVAYLKMTPDLMPNMDFPYVILVTTDPGARSTAPRLLSAAPRNPPSGTP